MIGKLIIGTLVFSGVVGFLWAVQPQPPQPTIQQWYNRFIEYIDGDKVAEATKRFSALVLGGMDPEKAFHQVVNS